MNARPASNRLPLATGNDGRLYIAVDDAVTLLRAIASACRTYADEDDLDLHVAAVALETEADALDVRAILRTT